MIIHYKIEDKKIDKDIFSRLHPNIADLEIWEQVIEEQKSEIEAAQASITFKLNDGKFHVITETHLLLKLFGEVKKYLGNQFLQHGHAPALPV
ncbi:MAG TPA: hypothetical protein VN721_08925 [Flavipsychrobacter sp.]|nr:hypothetical protein [Flavipsychrobacter sp.]